jgi:hypothetical protein
MFRCFSSPNLTLLEFQQKWKILQRPKHVVDALGWKESEKLLTLAHHLKVDQLRVVRGSTLLPHVTWPPDSTNPLRAQVHILDSGEDASPLVSNRGHHLLAFSWRIRIAARVILFNN